MLKTVGKNLLLLALVAVIAAPLSAADKKKKEKKAAPNAAAQFTGKLLKDIELTPEQKKQIEDLGTSFGAKLGELRKKTAGVMTEEYRKAVAAARKEAVAAGKKGKELKAAIDAAASLTDAQKAELKEIQAEVKKVSGELKDAVIGVLTDEQKAKLPKKAEGKKKKKAAA
jgi:Spy/CpxP family protein refolding chaperone